MDASTNVPPGFRFHPTEEELVDYYLRNKISSRRIDLNVIKDVDLYKIEPWDLQEKCNIGTKEQSEWYFFSHKDKKYPTGTRTNRATTAGFWKATGRDKAIYSKNSLLVGMRKTLVFYKGRAPNGQKSDYIMHEYRLETNENWTPQAKGWVVCKVFKKKIAMTRMENEHDSPSYWYDENVTFMPADNIDESPKTFSQVEASFLNHNPYFCKKEIDSQSYHNIPRDPNFHQLPQLLESQKVSYLATNSVIAGNPNAAYGLDMNQLTQGYMHEYSSSSVYDHGNVNREQVAMDQVTNWRVLDKFVASQLLNQQDVMSRERNYSNSSMDMINATSDHVNILVEQSNKEEVYAADQCASTSTSSGLIDPWK
ncbi:hypothetical protein MKX01_030943 [Papaver californicum]|nr:hypothetical protein MKX01_030943 [Papaver californicum]